MNTIIYPSIKPTIAPPNLENIPSIIVAFNIFSIIPLIFSNTDNIIDSIANTAKKAINSYNNIFNILTPLNKPLNPKNGKCLYRNVETGNLKCQDKTTINTKPTNNTASFTIPLEYLLVIKQQLQHLICSFYITFFNFYFC